LFLGEEARWWIKSISGFHSMNEKSVIVQEKLDSKEGKNISNNKRGSRKAEKNDRETDPTMKKQ
jgi:hypothetical protein